MLGAYMVMSYCSIDINLHQVWYREWRNWLDPVLWSFARQTSARRRLWRRRRFISNPPTISIGYESSRRGEVRARVGPLVQLPYRNWKINNSSAIVDVSVSIFFQHLRRHGRAPSSVPVSAVADRRRKHSPGPDGIITGTCVFCKRTPDAPLGLDKNQRRYK